MKYLYLILVSLLCAGEANALNLGQFLSGMGAANQGYQEGYDRALQGRLLELQVEQANRMAVIQELEYQRRIKELDEARKRELQRQQQLNVEALRREQARIAEIHVAEQARLAQVRAAERASVELRVVKLKKTAFPHIKTNIGKSVPRHSKPLLIDPLNHLIVKINWLLLAGRRSGYCPARQLSPSIALPRPPPYPHPPLHGSGTPSCIYHCSPQVIQKSQDLKNLSFVDISKTFQNVEADIYIDFCHMGKLGNEKVAMAMLPSLLPYLTPQSNGKRGGEQFPKI